MEGKVASTLLEEKKVIVIGGEEYEMASPSIATLVLASKFIKELPNTKLDEKRMITEMIQIADQITPVGHAMSAMILGFENFNKLEDITPQNLFKKRRKQGDILADKINTSNVKDVLNSFYKVLEQMNLTDFFQITTFLIELNLTKPTKKKVVAKTTAFGQ